MGKETLTRPTMIPQSVWDTMDLDARACVAAVIGGLTQRIEELERQVGINSGNSSLPPSADAPGKEPQKPKPRPSGRKRGGQPGHPKRTRPLIPPEDCDDVQDHRPPACDQCGTRLSGDDPAPQRKQVIELPIVKPVVIEHRVHTLECPCCGATTSGRLPDHVPRGCFGPQVVTVVMLLTGLGRLSHRMMAELLARLYGLEISVGQISRLQRIGRDALQSGHQEIAAHVRTGVVVNMDETGWREDGRRGWLWTVVGPLATLFTVRLKRSREVVHDLIGAAYGGIVGSDRYSAYNYLPDDCHQFCWAHLLRDFQALIERGGGSARVGRRLKKAGQELIHQWNRYRRDEIQRTTFRSHYHKLRDEIMNALSDGQRVRNAQTADLCRRLSNHCYSLFLFAETEGVSPTNNCAEQSLRRAVIFRKLSFGTESGSGSTVLSTTFSVVETCRRLGRDVQTDIRESVVAHFESSPAPKLLTDKA